MNADLLYLIIHATFNVVHFQHLIHNYDISVLHVALVKSFIYIVFFFFLLRYHCMKKGNLVYYIEEVMVLSLQSVITIGNSLIFFSLLYGNVLFTEIMVLLLQSFITIRHSFIFFSLLYGKILFTEVMVLTLQSFITVGNSLIFSVYYKVKCCLQKWCPSQSTA